MSANTKSVLITGASTGFGRLLVPAFLSGGWTVIATLRNAEQRAEIFAAERREHPQRLHTFTLDVTHDADRQAAPQFIAAQFGGRLDCLVNNAGFGLFGAVEEMSEAQIRAEMEVNFFGLVLLTRDLLPALRNARGKVINLSSLLGFAGIPLGAMYCASKFAVEGFSESLHYELAPHGVAVTLVEPGGFRTSFMENQQWAESGGRADSPYFHQTQAYSANRERRSAGAGTSPDPVIQTIVNLAQSRSMPLRVRCGNDAKAMYALKRILPEGVHAWLMRRTYRKLFGGGR